LIATVRVQTEHWRALIRAKKEIVGADTQIASEGLVISPILFTKVTFQYSSQNTSH
jgi:hypothetical protein